MPEQLQAATASAICMT